MWARERSLANKLFRAKCSAEKEKLENFKFSKEQQRFIKFSDLDVKIGETQNKITSGSLLNHFSITSGSKSFQQTTESCPE